MNQINKLYQTGRKFERNKSQRERKAKGAFYTPLEIVEYMVNRTAASLDIINNPYVKIMDLSCGAGYFLLKCFEVLKTLFQQNYSEIIAVNPELKENLNYDDIGGFIAEHNIWGVDIDAAAVLLVKDALDKAAGRRCKSNIICADSLLEGADNLSENELWNNEFDYIIGNPPYIGHKGVTAEYKKKLYARYGNVYRDKSDISYCFFQRGLELLKLGGTLSFITSRYFLEGPSAEGLRGYISDFDIEELIDFGDVRVFADAGVSVCVITMKKQHSSKNIMVKKLDNTADAAKTINISRMKHFEIEKDSLQKEGWLLLEPKKLEVFRKIERQSTHEVGDVFDSFQGIITGCDKAFVLSAQQAAVLGIEKMLLKPWIKNSHVDKFSVKPTDKLLIYADLIDNPENFPKAVSFAAAHKDKLMQRRECRKGVRQWYHLQWGRDSKVFESAKIVYPYKAGANRFAVDDSGMYCSADVYSLLLKEKYRNMFSLNYIAVLLNSKAMEFYFKSIAKKMSPAIYDYYPNKVLKIKLKLDEINEDVEKLANLLYNTQKSSERKCILQAIDREIYKMYNLNESQVEIIENSAGE